MAQFKLSSLDYITKVPKRVSKIDDRQEVAGDATIGQVKGYPIRYKRGQSTKIGLLHFINQTIEMKMFMENSMR